MRSYRQYCALAKALDVVGDRWSLLIVRNLLLGPQRWSELRAGLPGIAKNLLSSRLGDLAEHGVVTREDDRYALTERGQQLERALFALGDWGEAHFLGPPEEDEAIRLRYLMTSIRRKLSPTDTEGWLQLHVGERAFSIHLGPEPTVVQGEEPTKTAVHTDFDGLRALLFERRDPEELMREGVLSLRGDPDLVRTLTDAFHQPSSPRAD